jgi:hypothetical protein
LVVGQKRKAKVQFGWIASNHPGNYVVWITLIQEGVVWFMTKEQYTP